MSDFLNTVPNTSSLMQPRQPQATALTRYRRRGRRKQRRAAGLSGLYAGLSQRDLNSAVAGTSRAAALAPMGDQTIAPVTPEQMGIGMRFLSGQGVPFGEANDRLALWKVGAQDIQAGNQQQQRAAMLDTFRQRVPAGTTAFSPEVQAQFDQAYTGNLLAPAPGRLPEFPERGELALADLHEAMREMWRFVDEEKTLAGGLCGSIFAKIAAPEKYKDDDEEDGEDAPDDGDGPQDLAGPQQPNGSGPDEQLDNGEPEPHKRNGHGEHGEA